ncbi:hypothetical protein [Metabacillus sediminilitoris]|uniref:Uncharacterized protein n=1 Tax=Metabacillus sediminilitoris TaxID=2567941 RepID=A0A4S4BVR5_9BACI|nr:hypothetical protein [Metabacillus sediminilitoris]QGQ46189.1 hypothetical protein GMB29_13765 [Metabacillus sediminilitoris]THF79242.1 hypothetical protein E6W99_12875 [Metabacillus sediminilitoris]
MANPNRVRNGGFEQSITLPALPPFWSGTGSTETGTQLLEHTNARLNPGENISQELLPLQVGEIYQFQAAFSIISPLTGTLDIGITGQPARRFQAINIEDGNEYSYYNFDFTATVPSATLTIANNTDADVFIDVVSVKLTNPNLVRNSGFEQSITPALPPFWSGTGSTETGGTQLLGDTNVRLNVGENISQALLPLQVGQIYQFQVALDTTATAGTIDIAITGITTRHFQANINPGNYSYYSFDFTATVPSATLTITNNTGPIGGADVKIDVVSVKLANPNHVRNGGFEQSTPTALAPFWSGTGSTETGGTQLLGDNNALLNPGENISQELLPLQVGEIYQFQAAFETGGGGTTGTVDIGITGITTRHFRAARMVDAEYAYYSFDFKATVASPTLTIANNSSADVKIDVVSVKLA